VIVLTLGIGFLSSHLLLPNVEDRPIYSDLSSQFVSNNSVVLPGR